MRENAIRFLDLAKSLPPKKTPYSERWIRCLPSLLQLFGPMPFAQQATDSTQRKTKTPTHALTARIIPLGTMAFAKQALKQVKHVFWTWQDFSSSGFSGGEATTLRQQIRGHTNAMASRGHAQTRPKRHRVGGRGLSESFDPIQFQGSKSNHWLLRKPLGHDASPQPMFKT